MTIWRSVHNGPISRSAATQKSKSLYSGSSFGHPYQRSAGPGSFAEASIPEDGVAHHVTYPHPNSTGPGPSRNKPHRHHTTSHGSQASRKSSHSTIGSLQRALTRISVNTTASQPTGTHTNSTAKNFAYNARRRFSQYLPSRKGSENSNS
ncbi:hypothetical protein C8Q76DRAFT_709308 [Earliella scabrosa]|nr:hypothetical protein C8Q76DRAFT_709308 [Earliella scabrosa]